MSEATEMVIADAIKALTEEARRANQLAEERNNILRRWYELRLRGR